MTVSVYSREAIESIIDDGKFPKNTAVISFCDPALKHIDKDYSCVDYSSACDDVFYCEVDDLDLDYLPEKGYTYDSFFPEAPELAEYINKTFRDGKDIICQCEYGQSRSAGCAAAIMEHFYRRGIDIFAAYKYYPNQVVYYDDCNNSCAGRSNITIILGAMCRIIQGHSVSFFSADLGSAPAADTPRSSFVHRQAHGLSCLPDYTQCSLPTASYGAP